MDEMKIVTKFMRNAISKIVERTVHKKLGFDAKIRLNDITVTNDDEKAHVHLDIDADLDHAELLKILKNIGLG